MTKNNYQKEIQTKLTKGLLDMIILQFLDQEPMHGYQVITKIRKNFGVYFGPSTVYPLLGSLEKKGYVRHAKNGRAFVYEPVIGRDQATRSEIRHLLGRFFRNSHEALVLNILQDKEIDAQELKRLRDMLDRSQAK